MVFNPGAAASFLTFDMTENRLNIQANATTADDVGIYSIELTLDDSTNTTHYTIELYLICPRYNFMKLNDTFIPRYDSPSPLPYIHEITQFGKVIVRFNTTMKIPIDTEAESEL